MGQVRALVTVIGLSLVQIQGVIRQVIYTVGRFEITSPITAESYDMKSCYQLIVSITKCENLSLGILILSCFCFGSFSYINKFC